MAERKVQNKYIPADFNPSKIEYFSHKSDKKVKTGAKGYKVRIMAPFSMRCEACGKYIYKGTKFNARKEKADGLKYLTI